MALLRANSDARCLVESNNPLKRYMNLFFYRVNIFTGNYVLEPEERTFTLSITFLLIAATLFYSKAFLTGLIDGWSSAGQDSIMESIN